jgi:hypothetical protein
MTRPTSPARTDPTFPASVPRGVDPRGEAHGTDRSPGVAGS